MSKPSNESANGLIRLGVAFLAAAIEADFEPPPEALAAVLRAAGLPPTATPFKTRRAAECEAVLAALAANPYESAPPAGAKIVETLRPDDGVETAGEVKDLLASLGRMIDGGMETPATLFRVDGDDRWWVATVEGVISEASPDFVAEAKTDTEEDADAD